MKRIKVWIFAILIAILSTGCYLNDEVGTNQVGVQLDKNKIQSVVGAGVYTDLGFFADLKEMNVDTLTFSVEDPEVLTKDNQAVSVKITIQARRKSDEESVKNIFTKWSALIDDANLINTISATAREGMKVGTRKFTLPQLLDERSDDGQGLGLAGEIRTAIEEDAAKYSVELINVTVENIGASAEYMTILSETANLNAQIDKAKREQELINQTALNQVLQQEKRVEVANAQLLAEQAETNVQVEVATREGKIIAASNQVYLDNEAAWELEKLRLMQKMFNDKTVFFLQEGVDPTIFFNSPENTTVVPVSP